jgi:hypothetical protein
MELINQMISNGQFTWEKYLALQEHNKQRNEALIEQMGSKWLCHKDNHVQRLKKPFKY